MYLFLAGILFILSPTHAEPVPLESYQASTPIVHEFINSQAKRLGLDPEQIAGIIEKAHYTPAVIDKIRKPYEDLSWARYKKLLVSERRINGGKQFVQDNKAVLRHAEETYGVPSSIITSIIGIESNYGKVQMPFSVLDSLSTLSFNYPPRSKFFQSELAAFIEMVLKYNLNPTAIKGSYAGAIGIPQFMPSNYLTYAVRYKQDSLAPDLISSREDSIMSVANYLKRKGHWIHNTPIAKRADELGQQLAINKNSLVRFNAETLATIDDPDKAYLKGIWCNDESECWLVYNNFMSIHSYNPRAKYAMAVTQLAESI